MRDTAESAVTPAARGEGMQEKVSLHTFPFMKLDVYSVAKELAVRVQGACIRDAELRDQATRATKSAFLNLSEGLPSDSAADLPGENWTS